MKRSWPGRSIERGSRVSRLVDEAHDEHDAEKTNPDVDEEDAAPPQRLRHDTADGGAEGEADRGDARPDADGPGLGLRIGERGTHQCERGDVDGRRTDALQPPADVEEAQVRRRRAHRRGSGEQHGPTDQGEAATAAVRERRRRHDEHPHREAVGGDHPLGAFLTGVEVALDVRQGDVHDRCIQKDHEQADARRQQRQHLTLREPPRRHAVGH